VGRQVGRAGRELNREHPVRDGVRGGHVSGAHYNPAVTMAVLVRGGIGLREAPLLGRPDRGRADRRRNQNVLTPEVYDRLKHPFTTPPTRDPNDPMLAFYRDTCASQAAKDSRSTP
jgi:Major intrinsic protein